MSQLFANQTLLHNELESSATQSYSIGNKDTVLEHVIGDVSAEKKPHMELHLTIPVTHKLFWLHPCWPSGQNVRVVSDMRTL